MRSSLFNILNYYFLNIYNALKNSLLFGLVWFTFVNIGWTQNQGVKVNGTWLAHIHTKGGLLPFGLDISQEKGTLKAYALNGKERLLLSDLSQKGDSIFINIDVFDAVIKAKLVGNKLEGNWQRMVVKGKYISSKFTATKGYTNRFAIEKNKKPAALAGSWATLFIGQVAKDSTQAIGIFNQNGNTITGTFLTATGDYRYLEGVVNGDSLKMSTFDGTHLFLFLAKKVGTKLIGKFWSNIDYLENWTATLDAKASLPDATKLTYLKPNTKFDFSFPMPNGGNLSLGDPVFSQKIKVIQILGTWCPNCMDETRFLAPWYDNNKNRGVEVMGLAFEKSLDMTESGPKIEAMKARFGPKYPIALAGLKDKTEAAKALPMLNRIVGFPTLMVVDRQNQVRYIHTGFSGPGTGSHYLKWVSEFNGLIDKLLAE